MTENAFAKLIQSTGLTEASAVVYLGVGQSAIGRWIEGQGVAPETHMNQLEFLLNEQTRMAAEIVRQWKPDGGKRRLILEASKTDDEANDRGWPSMAAERAVASQVQNSASSIVMEIVDRSPTKICADVDQMSFNLFDDYEG